MAQFVNMFEVDLGNRSYPVALNQTVSEGNVNSNRVGAYVYKDGQPYNLGGACTGLVMRADGTTVPMTGVIDGNEAYVVLNQESCAIPGPIQVAVSWVSGNNTTTLIVAYGTVITTNTRSYVQSGPIADINTLLGYIGEVEQAAADSAASAASAAESAETAQNRCVRFDAAQSLTDTQKATARENIGAAPMTSIISLFSADATAIPANASMDDYTTPGNYLIANASIAATVTSYPFKVGGRIIVGQSSSQTAIMQIAISNGSSGLAVRAKSAGSWSEWSTPMQGTVSEAASLDDFRAISIYTYTASAIESLTSFPGRIPTTVGGLIVTINSADILNGRVQYVIPWTTDNMMAKRYYQTDWSAWAYTQGTTTTITVGANGDYTSLVDALDYVTGDALRNTWSEDNRLVIQLGEGTYSMNKVVELYESDNERYKWGLYIPRYCTVKGAGAEKTIVTYNYNGYDDWILGHISPFNMPYESALEDLTIDATNCRYCVHSDGDEPFRRLWALADNAIMVKNVRMVHHGYTDGHESSYNVPSAWGAGIRDNVKRTFINCEFVAPYMPWFCHNTIGMTKESNVRFENCVFINTNDGASFASASSYAGPTFISWGTGVKTMIEMANCYTNRYICIKPNTNYVAGANCDYFLYDDGDAMVEELKVNNAHLLDTWINRNCMIAVAGASITGFTPVSVNVDGVAGVYDTGSFRHGIATHNCAAGNRATVQTKGLIDLRLINVSGFSAGTLVGYANGAWVADSEHPIIRVIGAYVGMIV